MYQTQYILYQTQYILYQTQYVMYQTQQNFLIFRATCFDSYTIIFKALLRYKSLHSNEPYSIRIETCCPK